MIEFSDVLLAAISGLGFAVYWYIKNSIDPTKPVSWADINWFVIAANAIIGALVGIGFAVSGIPVEQAGIEAQMLTYSAATAVVATALQTFVRWIRNR